MSKQPYTPRPGSLPARVIEHLTGNADPALSCADIEQKFGAPSRNVRPILAAAVTHGALVMAKVEGRSMYMLPDADQAGAAAAPPASAPRKARRGHAGRQRANAARKDRVQTEQPVDPPAPGPVACLWDDGDIVLHGLRMNTDETSCTISEAHARKLHGFLDRLFGTPVARPIASDGVYAAHAVSHPLLTGEARR